MFVFIGGHSTESLSIVPATSSDEVKKMINELYQRFNVLRTILKNVSKDAMSLLRKLQMF